MDQQSIIRRGAPAPIPGQCERPRCARGVKALVAAPAGLTTNPRIGERLEEFDPREIRRLLVGSYELRYEIVESTIYVLRIWHTREER